MEKRSEQIQIRVTPTVKKRLEDRAGAVGLRLSTFCAGVLGWFADDRLTYVNHKEEQQFPDHFQGGKPHEEGS